jgi:hypothetical protein
MLQMKTNWLSYVAAVALGVAAFTAQAEQTMKPFILGSTGGGDVSSKAAEVKSALKSNGFEIAGEYSPYDSAHIIAVTNAALKKAGASHDRGGYIAAQRVAITKVGDNVQVSYTNPEYMGAAYHIKSSLVSVSNALKKALGAQSQYGVKDAKSADDLEGYHYTFGMEYFDEPYELTDYSSQKEAIAAVEKGLAAGDGDTMQVYRIDIPGTEQTLFGVGMKAASGGNKYMDETFIMTEIDFKDTRSTAHLPYEVLVHEGAVEALHARFRIAMNFPDLSMMGSNSFMNIMPSPDAIKEALTKASGGEAEDLF